MPNHPSVLGLGVILLTISTALAGCVVPVDDRVPVGLVNAAHANWFEIRIINESGVLLLNVTIYLERAGQEKLGDFEPGNHTVSVLMNNETHLEEVVPFESGWAVIISYRGPEIGLAIGTRETGEI